MRFSHPKFDFQNLQLTYKHFRDFDEPGETIYFGSIVVKKNCVVHM